MRASSASISWMRSSVVMGSPPPCVLGSLLHRRTPPALHSVGRKCGSIRQIRRNRWNTRLSQDPISILPLFLLSFPNLVQGFPRHSGLEWLSDPESLSFPLINHFSRPSSANDAWNRICRSGRRIGRPFLAANVTVVFTEHHQPTPIVHTSTFRSTVASL